MLIRHIVEKGIPQLTSSSLQRSEIILSGYNYILTCKTGACNSNADCLSQFPKDCENDFSKFSVIDRSSRTTLTSLDVKNELAKDPIISRVINYI